MAKFRRAALEKKAALNIAENERRKAAPWVGG